ncbi:hypothetical protein P7C70_g4364, partial [Phenoliferia sp. Uapishka_3]
MSSLRQRPITSTSLPADLPSSSTSSSTPPLTTEGQSSTPPLATPSVATGESTPYFISDQDDPFFSGLSLLDLLVVVDAHLELWTRGLRKSAVTFREKADKLVEESKARVEKIQRIKLPRVNSETFLSSMLDETREVLSPKDREKLERKYRELRQKTRDSMKILSVKWEEEKNVTLREKLSFFCGVMNVLVSALLLGFAPDWIPFYYTAQVGVYLPFRVYDYKKRLYHYFLFDLCYAVNLLCLVYLWVFPGSAFLFEACYGLTLGTLGSAIVTWRNSLVFHSIDKVTSLAIHIFPPLVFTTIRHFYPNANARYPALDKLNDRSPWRSMLINMVVYLIWQGLYFRYVIVARKDKIKEGRATSFTFLMHDKKRLIGKIAAKVPSQYREAAFMLGQAVYTFVTLIPPVFVLYDSKFWSSVYLLFVFSVSVWNGGSFYLEVFGRKFEKELLALRKELEEHQTQHALLNTQNSTSAPNLTRNASSSEMALNGSEMSRSTSLDGVAESEAEAEADETSTGSSGASLDGVIEIEQEDAEAEDRALTPMENPVGEGRGRREVEAPEGAVKEAQKHDAATEDA